MSNVLDEIKTRVADCMSYNFGMLNADKLAHEDAGKLVAALEAVMNACATEQGSFGDVSADSIVDAITEALA